MVTIHCTPCSILGRKCLASFQPFVSVGCWQFVCDFHVTNFAGFVQSCVGDSDCRRQARNLTIRRIWSNLMKGWAGCPNHLEGLEFSFP